MKKSYLNHTLLIIIVLFMHASFNPVRSINYFVPVNIPKTVYTLELDFDFQSGVLTGKGNIGFLNDGKRPIEVIAFDYALNSYQLLSLKQGNKKLKVFDSDNRAVENKPVYFVLNEAVLPGDSLTLEMAFKRSLFIDENPDEFEHRNLIPRLFWDDIPSSDAFRIKLNKLPDYTVVVSGRLNSETGYYINDNALRFGFFFSKKCSVIEDEIAGVQVRVLYPEKGKKVAELALQTAREAIPFYIDLLGMYPYSFLNILPGGPGVWGGYPYASGMVVVHGMQFFDKASERHWRWITAHEIGHEYWGEYVLDKDDPAWLWIAMGIYADWEFTKHIGLSKKKHKGWLEKYLKGVKKGYNTTFDISPSVEAALNFDRNNYVIHAKGFSFISALESVMGKKNFQAAYQAVFNEYGGSRMGYRDFQELCELHAGESLEWFFDPWVRSSKFLSITISDTSSVKTKDVYTTKVEINYQGDLMMPVPVFATFKDGSTQVKRTNRISSNSVLEFKSKSPLVSASIDPDAYIANLQHPPKPKIEDVKNEIQQLSYSGNGKKAFRVYQKIKRLESKDLGDDWYKLGMALFDGAYYEQSEKAFAYALKFALDEDRFINYCWLGHLQDILGKRSNALQNYKKALELWTEDDEYTHSQYNMLVDKNWVEKRLQTPFKLWQAVEW